MAKSAKPTITSKSMLTESQVSNMDKVYIAVEDPNSDIMTHSEFSAMIVDLNRQGVDVEGILREDYGVEF